MAQPPLQELTFPRVAWQHVSPCLKSDDVHGNPCPEIVPITIGTKFILIIGGSIKFNWERWEAVCVQMKEKPMISFTPVLA